MYEWVQKQTSNYKLVYLDGDVRIGVHKSRHNYLARIFCFLETIVESALILLGLSLLMPSHTLKLDSRISYFWN